MDHDLTGLLDSPARNYINEPEAKAYMKQLLAGLDYLHRNRIIHRDIKGTRLNLLYLAYSATSLQSFD